MKTNIEIKVHNGTETTPAVYVLSRGQNSGKPLAKPCPNCYAIQAETESLSEVRAVAHILFVSGKLKPFLHGSVIEFVTVKAYRKAFLNLWQSLPIEKVIETAQALAQLEQQTEILRKQLLLLAQLRKMTAFAALK